MKQSCHAQRQMINDWKDRTQIGHGYEHKIGSGCHNSVAIITAVCKQKIDWWNANTEFVAI